MSSSLAMMRKQLSKYSKIQDQIGGGSSSNKENAIQSLAYHPLQINTYHSYIPPSQSNSRQKQSNDSHILQSYQNDNMIKVSNDFLKELLEKQMKQEKKEVPNDIFSGDFSSSNQNHLSISSITPQYNDQRPISSSSINTKQNMRSRSTEKARPQTSYSTQKAVYNHITNQAEDSQQPAVQVINYTPFVRKTFSTTIYKNTNISAQGNINQNNTTNSISPNPRTIHSSNNNNNSSNNNQQSQLQQNNNYILKMQKSVDKQGNKILIVPRKDSGIKSGTKIIRSHSKNRVPSQNFFSHLVTNTEPNEVSEESLSKLSHSCLQISKYNHRQFESALTEERNALQVKKSREDFSHISRCNRVGSADLKSSHKKRRRNVSMHQVNTAQKQKQQQQQQDALCVSYLSNKNNLLFNTPINQKKYRMNNQEITPWDNNQVSQSDIMSDVFNQSPKSQFSPVKSSFLFNSNQFSQNFPKQMFEQKLINLQKSIQTNTLDQGVQSMIQNNQQQLKNQMQQINEVLANKNKVANDKVQQPVTPSNATQKSNPSLSASKPRTPISNKRVVPIRKISEKVEEGGGNTTNMKDCDVLQMTNYSDVITSKNIFRPLRPVSKNSRRQQNYKNQELIQQQSNNTYTPFKKPSYRCDKGLMKSHRIHSLNAVLQAFRNVQFIREFIVVPQEQNIFIPSMQKLYEQLDQHQEPNFMNTLTQFFQSFLQQQIEARLIRQANFSQNDEDACDLFEELAFSHQNNEVFFDLFGLLKYKFYCSECMNVDSNLEDFYIFKTLKMEINRFQSDFINNLYTTGRAEANYCDFCLKDKLFYQKMEFIQLPQLLIIPISFKIDQFYSNVNSYTSKNVFNQMDIPQDFFITDIYKNKVCYKLIGEIDKIGNTNQYISNFRDKKGFIQSYSDIKVKFIEDFPLESAQVLFYLKNDSNLTVTQF